MKFTEAINSLKYNKEKKYILIGEETYLKDKFVSAVHLKESSSDFLYYSPEYTDEAIDALGSAGLFGDRVIILKDFDKMKMDIIPFVETFPNYVILIASENANNRSKIVTHAIASFCAVRCSKMREYGDDYPTWISSKISNSGYTMDDGVDNFIFSQIGPDLLFLSNELKKLLLYKKDNKHITIEDARKVISLTSVGSLYDFLDKFLRKDITGAFSVLDVWKRSHNNFNDFVYFLSHYVEKLYRMLLLRDDGISPGGIADILKIPKFIIKTKYLPRALNFGKKGLSDLMRRTEELDIQLRTFKGNKKVIVEDFVMKIMS